VVLDIADNNDRLELSLAMKRTAAMTCSNEWLCRYTAAMNATLCKNICKAVLSSFDPKYSVSWFADYYRSWRWKSGE
jgi:hypothetical protein